ncbi:alpha/beta hydrolase-fold protein [uncultured Hyphomonas sp.]|uniref:alpha/beta hydrolase n=1 Tax=uncultured Hyphomonas sp. TaxID=225298 RepID=UPI002AAB3B6E|nr:alpha/beta hydrolase-fold protein [uncultured Hyphomonas sp.]
MITRFLLILTCFVCGAAPALPQAPSAAYVMERTEVRDIVSATGGAYRIFIQTPEGPAPEAGYPVLYILDGEDNFAVAAATTDRYAKYARDHGFEAGLIVGIGYAEESRRSLDYTPETDLTADARGRPVGGAGAFREFIVSDLRPAIEADFPVDTSRQSLFGHSYGGLFVLDTFFADPSLFQTYVAASPSIWFGTRAVLRNEAELSGKLAGLSPRTLVLTAGDGEDRIPPALAGSGVGSLRAEAEALASRLTGIEGLKVHHRTLTGETHGSALLPALGSAVAYTFAGGPL